jgi:hypothetical protein
MYPNNNQVASTNGTQQMTPIDPHYIQQLNEHYDRINNQDINQSDQSALPTYNEIITQNRNNSQQFTQKY